MKAGTRRALLEGAYICPVAFKAEYEYLCEPGIREEVDKWLRDIDMRLTRVAPDGPFVMVPVAVTPADTTRIKEDFLRFRDTYGPAIRMISLIRAGKDDFTLTPGEFIQLAELTMAVNESATLESQLRGLQGVIRDGSARLRNVELLKRLLDHLTREGYLVVFNANADLYQTTGKVTQLSQVLTFIAENTDIVGAVDQPEAEGPGTGLFEN